MVVTDRLTADASTACTTASGGRPAGTKDIINLTPKQQQQRVKKHRVSATRLRRRSVGKKVRARR
jgi:hypothetical protein